MSWIGDEIADRGGAVPFRVFMELALYHPARGYYRQAGSPVGRGADFLTAPAASPWYATVMAGLVDDLAARQGRLTLVDVGSGDGSFLAGVVEALGERAHEVLEGIVSVESAPEMRRLQRERLGGSPVRSQRLGSVADVEALSGPTVVHSSELYDALPVHRVVQRGAELRELWVRVAGGELVWEEREPAAAAVSYLERHGVDLVDGQIAEVNLLAEGLHRHLLGRVRGPGLALTLEYGFEARRLYDPRGRAGGTLACYRAHRLGRDPLVAPGEQDITAHVNWDDLRMAAAATGWVEVGLWPLAEMLVRAGLEGMMERRGVGADAAWDARTLAQRQEIKRLLDPDGMGSDLKVLVQGRGSLLDGARERLGAVRLRP